MRGADFWAMFAAARALHQPRTVEAINFTTKHMEPVANDEREQKSAKQCAEFADAMLDEFYKRYEWIENSVACGWRRRK